MEKKRFVIIGSGPAGISAAKIIARRDTESEITIIGKESYPPYSPTILPYFVSGKIDARKIFLLRREEFKEFNINLILGNGVSSISPVEQKVFLEDGTSISFDRLIIANGGKPIIPDIKGLKESKPLVLRTIDDAKILKKKAQFFKKAIVLGAGLIGMQTTQALSEMGISVWVIEMMDQVLPGYFDKDESSMIQKVYESHKVKFLISTSIEEVEFKKDEYVVSLKDGSKLNAHLLLVATGVSPNIELLKGSGIEMDRGVLVDNAMRTNIPNIFAAGDITQAEGFFGEGKLNQPILIHAIDQGRLAGQSALGEEISYEGNISMNLFHFFDNKAVSIGMTRPDSRDGYSIHKIYNPRKREYIKFVFNETGLVGVVGINIPIDPGILLQLIRRRIPIIKDRKEFIKKPLEVGRKLMCQNWR